MTDWADVPVFGQPPPGSAATVRLSAYGVLAGDDGQLAIVRTSQGLFLPGGGMERAETAHEAVLRELREECGLAAQVGDWRVRAVDVVYASAERTYFEKRSTFLEASVKRAPGAATEVDHELVWLAPEQAVIQLSHPSHRWAVSQWLGRRKAAPATASR